MKGPMDCQMDCQMDFLTANQVKLSTHFDRLRGLLEAELSHESPSVEVCDNAADDVSPDGLSTDGFSPDGSSDDAVSSLCSLFDLSSFERDLLLLCAAVELDSNIAGMCAQLDEHGRS